MKLSLGELKKQVKMGDFISVDDGFYSGEKVIFLKFSFFEDLISTFHADIEIFLPSCGEIRVLVLCFTTKIKLFEILT